MSGDRLLHWMSHVGSGSWAAFRSAVDTIYEPSADDTFIYRELRMALSNMAHVDFFINGTRRWAVRRPCLLGLAAANVAVFAGARTPGLHAALVDASGAAGLSVETGDGPGRLMTILLKGDPAAMASAASAVGIGVVDQGACRLLGELPGVTALAAAASRVAAPRNWEVRSWSFDRMTWEEGARRRTLREYTNRFGQRRYLLSASRRGPLIEIEKPVGLYAAASVQRRNIAVYDVSDGSFRVPLACSLPEAYSRVLTLTTGEHARMVGRERVHESVPPAVGCALAVLLGQRHPLS